MREFDRGIGDIAEVRRAEGLTFASCFENTFGSKEIADGIRANLQDSGVLYADFEGLRVSADGNHVLAVGIDSGAWAIIRDGQEVYRQESGRLISVKTSPDYSRLLFNTTNGSWQNLYFVGGKDGEAKCLRNFTLSAGIAAVSSDLDTFLTYGINKNIITFTRFECGDKEPIVNKGFSVKGGYEGVQIESASDDYSDVLWRTKVSNKDRRLVFHNDTKLIEARWIERFAASTKPLRWIAVVSEERIRKKTLRRSVVVDGACAIKNVRMRTGDIYASPDLSVAMLPLYPEDKMPRLLCFKAGLGWGFSGPIDAIEQVTCKDEDTIVARVKKDGVLREVVLRTNAKDELSGQESDPSAVLEEINLLENNLGGLTSETVS